MYFFNFDEAKTQTKMFVSQLHESKEEEAENPKVIAKSITGALASNILIKIAPDLIDHGAKLLSSAISKFAKESVTQTLVHKNIDAKESNKLFLPNKITLVRGNFASNSDAKTSGEKFGDGEKQEFNQTTLISDKALHIEIDVIQSEYSESIYFQPSSYFYKGEDTDGNNIDEITIAFAFVPAGEAISAYKDLTFQTILQFKQLENNQLYTFKSKEGYDTSYQSPWIVPKLSKGGSYTLVIGIQEIRQGNSFAQLVEDIYTKHDDELTLAIKKEVANALKKRRSVNYK